MAIDKQKRADQLSTYRTTWHDKGDIGGVTYINTEIVRWVNNTITLNSDGWETVTTKRKMNQASRQFALGFSVYQLDHKWYVNLPSGETVDYRDGISFPRN
jgi:hypothetical protein